MILHNNIKEFLGQELTQAKEVWIASAMISRNGLKFIQEHIPKIAKQHYLIGIDLNTEPEVFVRLYANSDHNARVYKSAYTYHPKVYLILGLDDSLKAIIGSSNTTTWGLEKNVEMNFQISDQAECTKLLDWFNGLYAKGHIITPEFIDSYRASFVRMRSKVKEIDTEAASLKLELAENSGQFFTHNQHRIFKEIYHTVENDDLKELRKEVRARFLELHSRIYPAFVKEGLVNLHAHHQKKEWVSRHFFNRFSGFYINAMWLHYGKSESELAVYNNGDRSINNPSRFINNIRMQVIIHDQDVGLWLMLGRGGASLIDRKHLKNKLADLAFRTVFFDAFKNLGKGYWINAGAPVGEADIVTADQLAQIVMQSREDAYFIIGRNIYYLDNALSDKQIATTVMEAFKKLYVLYELIRHG
ncbi:phospholipase D-like domain-containing protein [Pedobacter zeae]|uniref:Phospholipase D-like domain-containing protein n=1 Tax=Pedobacter zeae TaxID=1737356 RepID=A0A7W6P6Q0_9SPHI|nr:phospholipase D-like domain-containing protein [Pedobacter zeae]MBB4108144.1 hypothetical protein [Pedobacter zeae]GGG94706.1 hypothetical protein GCM10007422_05210 [Pedobacter zeae]